MSMRFTTIKARNDLTQRLVTLAMGMQRSFDQGHTGLIRVTDDMIGDVIAAAAVVALAETDEPPKAL